MTWPAEEIADPKHKPFWRRKRWMFAGAFALVGFAASIYVVTGWSEVARLKAAIRARGEPVTHDELAEYYARPPADRDATRLWLSAGQSLELAAGAQAARKLPFLGDVALPSLVGQPWAELEPARQFLQKNSEAMRQLHDAADLGGEARYPVDFRAGIFTLLKHVQMLRNAARCLALEANARAHSGDMHGAAESLRTGLLLAESLKNEPIAVSQLVRIAIHGMIVGQIKRIGPANFPAADLERLQETLAQIDFRNGLRRAAIGERVLGLTTFDDPVSAGLPSQTAYFLWMNRGADELAYLTIMSDFVALTEAPWNELPDQMNAWSQALPARMSRWTLITSLLTPAISIIGNNFARGETVNRLSLIDVAIARYSQQHGRPPTELAALVPDFWAEVPLDPTSGAPFSYQAMADRYVLYSPTKVFPIHSSEKPDAETGANPNLVFRRPPLPDEPKTAANANAQESKEQAGENSAEPKTSVPEPDAVAP
ncbi:MAG TPA: hypothetical protein VGJ26_07375 [Pirellulales bacterium]|jgi:hypothetical protein